MCVCVCVCVCVCACVCVCGGGGGGGGVQEGARGFGWAIVDSNDSLLLLTGLDILSTPSGPIRDAQDLAAAAFGAEATWFLVNGSTVGIHAAILACCSPADVLIIARNCHMSAFSGMVLAGEVTPLSQGFQDVYILKDFKICTSMYPSSLGSHMSALSRMVLADEVTALSERPLGVCNVARVHMSALLGWSHFLDRGNNDNDLRLPKTATHFLLLATCLLIGSHLCDNGKLGQDLLLPKSSACPYALQPCSRIRHKHLTAFVCAGEVQSCPQYRGLRPG